MKTDNIMTFGKYKGKTFKYVRKHDAQYLLWLVDKHYSFNIDDSLLLYINSHIIKIKKDADNQLQQRM